MVNIFRKKISLTAICLILILNIAFKGGTFSEEIPLSIKLPIFLKVLSYDRNLQARSNGQLNMLILYQSSYNYSQLEKDDAEDILDNLSISSIEGMKINYSYYDLDEGSLSNEIVNKKANIIFVCPLKGYPVGSISKICRTKKIISFSDLTSYVQTDLSIGVEMNGDKSQIVINLKNVKSEGADFSSQLLKIARVIE